MTIDSINIKHIIAEEGKYLKQISSGIIMGSEVFLHKVIINDELVDDFAENYMEVKGIQPNSHLWYESNNSSIIAPNNNLFNTNLLSNVYDDIGGRLIFDNELTEIGDAAFSDNISLITISLPSTLEKIGRYAFKNCSSLTSIVCNKIGTPPILVNNEVFDNTNDCPIYVHNQMVDTYKNDINWNKYSNRIIANPDVD